jgi:DivIVA domain-containing protein
MAASLSRPDPSSPASVAEASFNTTRRGYNADEVRAFLVSVAAEIARLQERERQLEAELRDARDSTPALELDDETVTKLLGEETLRVLQTARESASQIKVRAEENAARTVREASDEANRVRQDVEVEVARKRQDATSDAEAEVALAKQQGREMVNEARAYRERVLADLDRRTTLARQQIEELIHGRDRLLQVFERARLVAVDVTSELRAVDSPDELVNLSPTTGPVPIMVPNQRRPDREPAADADETEQVDDATDAIDVPHLPAEVTRDDVDADTTSPTSSGSADDRPDVVVHHDADDTVVDDTVADETVADETVDDGSDAGREHDEVAEDAEDGEDAVEAAVTADESSGNQVAPSAPATPGDTNVVSLFRGRPSPTDAAIADDHPSTDDGARPDVGGIFERLRHEVPTADAKAAESNATAGTDETSVEAAADEDDEAPAVDVDVEAGPSAFSRRDEAIVPLIVSGARRLKRVLADEQNEALDTLRQKDPVIALDALVPSLDDHVARYLGAIGDELTGAAAAGAVEAGARDNKTMRGKLARAGALTAAHDQLRLALVTPLRDRLGRAVTDGDGDNDDITKRVRAVYREWKTQHIDDQLDDIFRRAFSGGLSATIEPATHLTWTVDPSASACPDCEDNSLAGGVPSGEPFPTGHLMAPAHPGCRCLALPAD